MQLAAMRHQLVTQLSGGEMQRVLIARALVQEAELLILDEPTSALDLHHQISTLDHIERVQKNGTTIVSTMHDITLGAMYAERIVIMQHGKVLLDGHATDVIHSPELKKAFDDAITIHTLDNGRPVIVANKATAAL
jgi:iron complex transport system ATP-binding protein